MGVHVMVLDLDFFTALFSIIVIDIVLGGDNAIVIAMASRNLPDKQRNRAIVFGTGAAIAVRAALTFVAVYLLSVPFLRLMGGLLLVWIAFNLLTSCKEHADVQAGANLGQAIRTIVIADVVMGLDNVLAIAGAADTAHNSYFLVILGLLISVPIIIWGSKIILTFMDRFPIVIYVGAGVLAWTAGKMITDDHIVHAWLASIPHAAVWLPLLLIVAVLAFGKLKNRKAAQN